MTSWPITLWDVAKQAPVDAVLVEGIAEKQLQDWQQLWLPAMFKSVMRTQRVSPVRTPWPQHHHWDWRAKAEALRAMLAYKGYCIMCSGVTQGLMIVDTTTQRARIADQAGKHLVYVNFVENAPWNRREIVGAETYRGVGSILIGAAVSLSLEEEFKGRIGLHSLPQANGFYANHCGMTDLGIDPAYQGLRYFEMTSQQAEDFIGRSNQS